MINVSQFGSLQAAINAAPVGSVIVNDVTTKPLGTVTVNKPCMILFAASIDFGNTGQGICVTSNGVALLGIPSTVSIMNTLMSAVMLQDGADDFYTNGLSVENYNMSNTNGHAGLFLLGLKVPIQRAKVIGFRALGGNGNGIRIGNVNDFVSRDCYVQSTTGQSAEGVTVNGSNVDIDRLTVDKAFTTGLLVYPDRNLSNIRLRNLTISNSSQITAAGLQKGNNFAVEVQAQQYTINGLVIENLCAYDNQAVPTQQGPLKVGNNKQGGKVYAKPLTFYGSGNKTSTVEYVFDNLQSEFIPI